MSTYTFEQNAMGTRVTITIYSQKTSEELETYTQKAFTIFKKLEQQFSIFLENSEINQINKKAGEIIKASPLMLETVAYALKIAKETNGIFNPLLGSLTKPGGLYQKTDPYSYKKIVINLEDQTLIIPKATALDLNSIVKGLAIDLAMEALTQEENIMIEAGGDFRMKGLPSGENYWKIGIRDPHEPTKIITILKLKAGAICTSGRYFREEKATQEKRHHLINPHSNKENIASSITVIAPTAKEADALSTTAFFMPIEEAIPYIQTHPYTSCLIIDRNNEVFASHQMRSHFSLTPSL